MYRVIAVAGTALVLAGCTSNSDLSKYFRNEPVLDTVRFESEPPGADARTSTGQSCRTPCALALPGTQGFDVTFTMAGFQPSVEKVEAFPVGDGTTKLRPNPVLAELTPMAPPPKKKAMRKRHVTHPRKPALRRAAKRPARPAMKKPAPIEAAPPPPPPQQAPSPWPAAPPPRQQ
jgi:hypothetical protein